MSKTDTITKTEKAPMPEYASMVSGYQKALQVVDDVVLKNYLSALSELDVVPLDQNTLQNNIKENVLFFKINEMVYQKNEFSSYKFASVFNSLASAKGAVFIIIDSNGIKTDFYMGVRSFDNDRTTSSLKNTLKNALYGQFPGIKTTDYTIEEIQRIIGNIKSAGISAVSCVANCREEKQNKNEEFVQGLEKLALSMSGQKYTGIIIANTTGQEQIRAIRKGYENIYTQLSPFASTQINYGQNIAAGRNESVSDGTNKGITKTVSESDTHGTAETTGSTVTHGTSKENTSSKVLKGLAAATTVLGAALAPVTGGASLAVGGVIAGGLGLAGSAAAKTISDSMSQSRSDSVSKSYTSGNSLSDTRGSSHTLTSGTSLTEGSSHALTLTAHDKTVENILARIDKQLKRMDEFESLGMYECAAYFLSNDQYASEMAASTYKALMGGENTGVEISVVNSWGIFDGDKTSMIGDYVKNFMHPVFRYNSGFGGIEVTPSAMVSGNELAIHIGLPQKSVCGLPVIEHADFGKEVVTYDGKTAVNGVNLGKIFNMGGLCPNSVLLDKNSLTMHTFVTGSTGSGKSNTIYELIRQCSNLGAGFMIIEPAKGEYKHVFGNKPDVRVFGTNPQYTELLRINPFKFSKGIHVLEHVDRLVEIFNVCWPMYAAMPAVLKEALLKAYEDCGWDFSSSENIYNEELFPTFLDLQEELIRVIEHSAYSEEVKSNYMGSLVTRVRSLTNGLNGRIFAANEIDNHILFDTNVIIDLSRIGSLETKSLIMGLLIMRLSEHRSSGQTAMNTPFRHLTVLEEAHNILKRTSTEQNPESPNLTGKSVEMISNAIAEMRTYGEGFVIADQSPSAIDISAIRNTNTKIIMRLPDEADRRLAGKSAGLKDEQLDEIAKLPRGVAVVYQNDWIDPVLCKIQKFRGEESQYQYKPTGTPRNTTDRFKKNLLGLLLKTRVNNPVYTDVPMLHEDLKTSELSSRSKIMIKKIIDEYEQRGKLTIWDEDNFESLAKVVSAVLNGKLLIKQIVETSSDFDVLTDTLMHTVGEKVQGMSAEYLLAASQCLMRAESSESDDYKEIYSAWITNLRKKGVY